jgi:Zn-dependent protease with chaperone function
VDEGAAPGLWAIWNEFDRTTRRSNRVLLIDAELNASMSEHRRYFGLMRRQLTMTVGLPLLIVLDEHAVRAVLAHEVAHARLQHTSGAANLHEFIVAVRNLFDYFDPDRTITGRIAYTILHSLLTWILMEYRSLSRKNELDADLESAERVGAQDAARALVLFYAYGARMKDLVIAPLEKALVGAIRAPTPPLQRLINQLDAVRALERIEEADLMAEEETDSEHPPLRARLANLGWADIPKVEAAKGSAAEALLSTSTMKDLLERFDGDWQSRVNQIVGIY